MSTRENIRLIARAPYFKPAYPSGEKKSKKTHRTKLATCFLISDNSNYNLNNRSLSCRISQNPLSDNFLCLNSSQDFQYPFLMGCSSHYVHLNRSATNIVSWA